MRLLEPGGLCCFLVAAISGHETAASEIAMPYDPCVFCSGMELSLDCAISLRGQMNVDVARCRDCGLLFVNPVLVPEQIAALVTLIERWPELEQAGMEFPEVEPVVFEVTPELIAEGEQLYNIACKTCHGVEAYGTRMAPSLNNQTFLSETPDAAIYQIIAGGVPETVMPAWAIASPRKTSAP